MPNATRQLDRLLQTLQALADEPRANGDAIDRILAQPPRQTRVRSLGDDPTVKRFREDLTNGLIRVDTANALLGLITRFITGIRAAR